MKNKLVVAELDKKQFIKQAKWLIENSDSLKGNSCPPFKHIDTTYVYNGVEHPTKKYLAGCIHCVVSCYHSPYNGICPKEHKLINAKKYLQSLRKDKLKRIQNDI